MTHNPTRDEREQRITMTDSHQQPAVPNVELARLTKDQVEYVEKIKSSVAGFDRSVVVGGPRRALAAGE